LPSHVPSRPQDEAGLCGQTLGALGATPAATSEQMPGAEGVLQDLQVSVQALLQQTPSTQKPLAQSALQPQAAPLVARAPPSPHDLPSGPPSTLRPPPPWLLWQPEIASANRAARASFAGNPLIPEKITRQRDIGTALVIKEDDLDAVVLGASGR
jgi:hypothetical protein